MELNDLITLIIFLIFFVLPSVFKRMKKKKKSPFRIKKKKKASLLGKLGDALKEFKQELEKQAMKARQKAEAEKAGTIWDEMDDREKEVVLPEAQPSPAPVKKRVPKTRLPPEPFLTIESTETATAAPSVETMAGQRDPGLPELCGSPARHPLQQAVIWSEILGKPKGQRKNNFP